MYGRPTDPRDSRRSELAEGIGWMVMAAASLDVALAMLAEGLNPAPGSDWMTITSKPGGSLKELRRVMSQLPKGARIAPTLRLLYADAFAALEERNRVTHSLHGLEGMYTEDGPQPGQFSIHPRGRTHLATPTPDELADLTERLRKLGRRATDITPGVMMVSADGSGWVRINRHGEKESIDEPWLPSAREWKALSTGNDPERPDD